MVQWVLLIGSGDTQSYHQSVDIGDIASFVPFSLSCKIYDGVLPHFDCPPRSVLTRIK
jgi:hypothetical protein